MTQSSYPAWWPRFAPDVSGRPAADQAFPDWWWLSQAVAQLVPGVETVIGISGSQGSGKSTFASLLAQAYAARELRRACVSLDDFYLDREGRRSLAARVHPLLATRGVPGTHETELIAEVLTQAQGRDRTVEVPSFDKGTDDRRAARSVRTSGLIFEGWCLGVEPQSETALETPVNELERGEDPDGVWRKWVNRQVSEHYSSLWKRIDFWIQLEAPGFDQVRRWRALQEQALPAAQRMEAPALNRFIDHYERLTRHLWASPPRAPGLVVTLGTDHRIEHVREIAL